MRLMQLATYKRSTVKRIIEGGAHKVVVIERHTNKILVYRTCVTEIAAKMLFDTEKVKAASRG